MLTALKDIFLPTWKNVGRTILVAIPFTYLGMFLMFLSVHGSDYFEYVGYVFLLPALLLSKVWDPNFGIYQSLPDFLAFAILQFFYLYVPISVVLYCYSRRKPG